MTFVDTSGVGIGTRHRYENIVPGRPTSHSGETCRYCIDRNARIERARRRRLAEAEAEELFVMEGLGRARTDEGEEDDVIDLDMETDTEAETEEETDAGMDVDAEPGAENEVHPADGWELAWNEGDCHGVQDIAFTGLTETRHGDAWCHYMYYGRLRTWDGLIVLVGVPVSSSLRLPFTFFVSRF